MDIEAQLDNALADLAIAKRTIKEYDVAFLKLREEHAVAVFAAQEAGRALRDLTVKMALEKKP